MAKIQFLTILLVVTCFLGGVVSVTDKEFKVSDVFMKILLREFIKCTSKISFVNLISRLYPQVSFDKADYWTISC